MDYTGSKFVDICSILEREGERNQQNLLSSKQRIRYFHVCKPNIPEAETDFAYEKIVYHHNQ